MFIIWQQYAFDCNQFCSEINTSKSSVLASEGKSYS